MFFTVLSLLLLLWDSFSIFIHLIFNSISEHSFLYLLPLLLTMVIIVIVTIDIRPSEITIPYLFRKTWTQNNLFMPGQRSKGIIPY
jgi:hypothetical protein